MFGEIWAPLSISRKFNYSEALPIYPAEWHVAYCQVLLRGCWLTVELVYLLSSGFRLRQLILQTTLLANRKNAMQFEYLKAEYQNEMVTSHIDGRRLRSIVIAPLSAHTVRRE